uniref:VASP_tetra domain-containing protein n=1 Tax=Rhabditophanes sp. KR3021 TaxID=114890 RepID=A0AC35U0A6_9BILA
MSHSGVDSQIPNLRRSKSNDGALERDPPNDINTTHTNRSNESLDELKKTLSQEIMELVEDRLKTAMENQMGMINQTLAKAFSTIYHPPTPSNQPVDPPIGQF